MNTECKLEVLYLIAKRLNEENITWAIGGSLLLFLNKVSDKFNDIDIMILAKDAHKVAEILSKLGNKSESDFSKKYKTEYFYEYTINDVEVDIMGGLKILSGEKIYDCSLLKEEINKYIYLEDEKIYLHSIKLWRHYYSLMGRVEKVKMIDDSKILCESVD